MKFRYLITYARQRGFTFEQIALRRIVLFHPGAYGYGYRETHLLTDGGWWVDAAILHHKWQPL